MCFYRAFLRTCIDFCEKLPPMNDNTKQRTYIVISDDDSDDTHKTDAHHHLIKKQLTKQQQEVKERRDKIRRRNAAIRANESLFSGSQRIRRKRDPRPTFE